MPLSRAADDASRTDNRPLVVGLDETLIRPNSLMEMIFGYIGNFPFATFKLPFWLWSGRAALKRKLAESTNIDVTTLPYNENVLVRIRDARAQGRKVYLASASDGHFVQAVAQHLSLDGWFASNGTINLSGDTKAHRLVEEFGENNFDYIGNGLDDLSVWKRAAAVTAVNPSRRVASALAKLAKPVDWATDTIDRSAWVRILRPHQWIKNGLVIIPLLTAHQFTLHAALLSLAAVAAFSAGASAVYVFNDLIDIQSDRGHPTKRNRPFAAGGLSIATGLIIGIVFCIIALALAITVSSTFSAVLLLYFIITSAYSLVLKRKMLIDAVTLASLYTIRVIGGAVAINVPMSEWLLIFSMFFFLALALTKRYSELAVRFDTGLPNPINRDYQIDDLPVISSLAAASGFSAVIVFALYLSSDTVRMLYAHSSLLWLICPLLIYWMSRTLMMSHRRLMHDDPIVFALTDRVSWAVAVLIGLLGFLAI